MADTFAPMYEVKVTIAGAAITIATFEARSGQAFLTGRAARNAAVRFAKQVDSGWAVDVIDVANEDNRERAFGLVYHRDARF